MLFLAVLGCGLVVGTGYWAQVPGAPPPRNSSPPAIFSNLLGNLIYKIDIPPWQLAVILGIGATGLFLVIFRGRREPSD